MNAMIIRPGALGDTLMLMPALIDLQGKAAVTLVGRQPGLQFAGPYTRRAVDMEGAGWQMLFSESPGSEGLPVEKPDLVAAFFRDENGSIARNLRSYFPDIPVRVFPSYPDPESAAHEAHYLLTRLASAGFPVDPEGAMDRAESSPLLTVEKPLTGRPYFLFHPGSGSATKNMPPEFWLELIPRVKEAVCDDRSDVRILLGPAEEDLHPLFERGDFGEGVSVLFSPPSESILSLLRNASLYVGHDSGITHLAAMSGAPTLAIFRTTDENRWRPLGPKTTILQSGLEEAELVDRILGAARRFTTSRR